MLKPPCDRAWKGISGRRVVTVISGGPVWLDLAMAARQGRRMSEITLMRNVNFRTFLGASALAQLGSGVFSLAFPWLASLLTRDPLLIGAVAMAPQLPWLFFALPAGVWTDRLDHRRTILVGNLIHAALALSVLALALMANPGTGAIWALFALAFLQGSNDVLRDNMAQTFLPQVVQREGLEAANAVLQTSENMMWQFVGPPLAGALIALSSALPFAFEAGVLITSAMLMAAIRPTPVPRAAAQAFWPALREGLGWLWANPPLRRLAMVLGAYNFLYQVVWSVMVLFAQDALGLGPVAYGLLLSALASGGLAGGLAAPWILARLGVRRGLLLSVAGFCLSTAVLIFTRDPWLAGLALFGDAFTSMTWNVATVSYRQRHIPAPLLGRVNSVYRWLGSGPRPYGSLLGGALVAWGQPLGDWALHLPFAFATLGGIVMLAYSLRALRFD
jgi:MFS family permease